MDISKKRQVKMVNILLEKDSYISLEKLSSYLNASTKTLQMDIKRINEYLHSKNINIVSKRGAGIKLEGNDRNKINLQTVIIQESNKMEPLSPIDRQIFLMKSLVIEGEQLSYNFLSNKLLISKTSIVKDIKEVRNVLSKNNIKFVSNNYGTRIDGEESNIRKGGVYYITQYLTSIGRKTEELYGKNRTTFLKRFFEEKVLNDTEKELLSVIENLKINLSEYQFNMLLINLLVQKNRVIKGNIISKSDGFLFDEVSFVRTYPLAVKLAENVLVHLSNKQKDHEIKYLNKQVISLSIKSGAENVYEREDINELRRIINKLIRTMSTILAVDLSHDNNLFDLLISHIVPMIERIESHITIKNPLLNEVEKQYGVMMKATWLAMSDLENYMDCTLDRNEISFLTLYFQAAVEKIKTIKKILVVCPTGMGTSELMANKISKILPSHCHIEIASIGKIVRNKLEEVDLLISAVELDIKDKRVINVSPLINDEDLRKISLASSQLLFNRETNEEDDTIKIDSSLIDHDFIYTQRNFNSKESILTFMTNELATKNYISKNYKKMLFEREKIGATDLKTGVAIPHASPKEVKRSNISIMTLRKAVIWKNHQVDCIILLSIAEKDIEIVKTLLSEIYKLVAKRENVEKLLLNKSNIEIIQFIGDGSFDR